MMRQGRSAWQPQSMRRKIAAINKRTSTHGCLDLHDGQIATSRSCLPDTIVLDKCLVEMLLTTLHPVGLTTMVLWPSAHVLTFICNLKYVGTPLFVSTEIPAKSQDATRVVMAFQKCQLDPQKVPLRSTYSKYMTSTLFQQTREHRGLRGSDGRRRTSALFHRATQVMHTHTHQLAGGGGKKKRKKKKPRLAGKHAGMRPPCQTGPCQRMAPLTGVGSTIRYTGTPAYGSNTEAPPVPY